LGHYPLLSPDTVPDGDLNHARMRDSGFVGNAERRL
jgi:hypothetical protein